MPTVESSDAKEECSQEMEKGHEEPKRKKNKVGFRDRKVELPFILLFKSEHCDVLSNSYFIFI